MKESLRVRKLGQQFPVFGIQYVNDRTSCPINMYCGNA